MYVDTINDLLHGLQDLIFVEAVKVHVSVETHVVSECLQQSLEVFSFIGTIDELCMICMT